MSSNLRDAQLPADPGEATAAAADAIVEAPRPSSGGSWRALIDRVSERIGTARSRLPGRGRPGDPVAMAGLLLSNSGEAERLRISAELADLLRQVDDAELLQFFLYLASQLGPDEAPLKLAAAAYLERPDRETAAALGAAAEPRRRELLRRLNMAPQGTALIVLLRERALAMAKQHPELATVTADLLHLLSSWFNRGFLKAEQINWNSPAAILENVIKYEAVHEIRDWDSLRSRLQGNRRCFGFFHPAMPGVPLIFIEVALTTEMSGAIAPLLSLADQEAPNKAPTTAIFYSINNCHKGLGGINLGDLLIKQVVLDLRTEFPSLKNFATLSPIPGFRRWLASAQKQSQLVPPAVAEVLATPEWWLDPALSGRIASALPALCAKYLTGTGPDGLAGRASDPVARFHLSNGARLERINWLADLSAKGIAESWGMMVNYSYRLNSIEANHRAFSADGKVIVSGPVQQLRDLNTAAQRFSFGSLMPSLGRAGRAPKAERP